MYVAGTKLSPLEEKIWGDCDTEDTIEERAEQEKKIKDVDALENLIKGSKMPLIPELNFAKFFFPKKN